MLLCLDIFCKGNVVELLRVLSLKFLGSQAQIFHSVTRLNLFFGGPDFDSFADSNLISPYGVTAESLTKVVRIEEMITTN